MADAAAREENQAQFGALIIPLQLDPHSSSAPADRDANVVWAPSLRAFSQTPTTADLASAHDVCYLRLHSGDSLSKQATAETDVFPRRLTNLVCSIYAEVAAAMELQSQVALTHIANPAAYVIGEEQQRLANSGDANRFLSFAEGQPRRLQDVFMALPDPYKSRKRLESSSSARCSE